MHGFETFLEKKDPLVLVCKIAIIGGAGKMGRGLCLVLLEWLGFLAASSSSTGSRQYEVIAIDSNTEGLAQLHHYLTGYLSKRWETGGSPLLQRVQEILPSMSTEEYARTLLKRVRFETTLEAVEKANLVFEAVVEDEAIKIRLFRDLSRICSSSAYFLSNTSSIPIGIMAEQSGLQGRLIGFHFYNPPAVQKLIELIIPPSTQNELKTMAADLVRVLDKVGVEASDISGFIGNGHFIREAVFAFEMLERLQNELSFPEAVWALNEVTREVLIRPMGIFQVIDYVGLDVFSKIASTMRHYLEESELYIPSSVTEVLKKGGAGFFEYEKDKIKGIYSITENHYIPLSSELQDKIAGWLSLSSCHAPSWKTLHKDENKETGLAEYFSSLDLLDNRAVVLAKEYIRNSRDIAAQLVTRHVAKSQEDVARVLHYGFYHLYSPLDSYIAKIV